MVVLGQRLNSMIFEVFSNLNHSVIPFGSAFQSVWSFTLRKNNSSVLPGHYWPGCSVSKRSDSFLLFFFSSLLKSSLFSPTWNECYLLDKGQRKWVFRPVWGCEKTVRTWTSGSFLFILRHSELTFLPVTQTYVVAPCFHFHSSADLKRTFEDITCPPVPSFLILSSELPSAGKYCWKWSKNGQD